MHSDLPRHHVYPISDVLLHVTDGTPCWCNPALQIAYDADGVPALVHVIHTAADGRPTQERPFLHGAN